MVKGITRQVIVVKGADKASFDQAIFLVRDDIVSKGGISEDALLKEARQLCSEPSRMPWHKVLWSGLGAAVTGLIWIATAFL